MTPEFGAASQLEKIDMLDFADAVAINKFERRGAEDALRDVRRQLPRNRESFGTPLEELPVFGTIAARFNDDGVTALYQHLRGLLAERGLPAGGGALAPVDTRVPHRDRRDRAARAQPLPRRGRRDGPRLPRRTDEQVAAARRRQALRTTRELLAADRAGTTAAAEVEALLERRRAGAGRRVARPARRLAGHGRGLHAATSTW